MRNQSAYVTACFVLSIDTDSAKFISPIEQSANKTRRQRRRRRPGRPAKYKLSGDTDLHCCNYTAQRLVNDIDPLARGSFVLGRNNRAIIKQVQDPNDLIAWIRQRAARSTDILYSTDTRIHTPSGWCAW